MGTSSRMAEEQTEAKTAQRQTAAKRPNNKPKQNGPMAEWRLQPNSRTTAGA